MCCNLELWNGNQTFDDKLSFVITFNDKLGLWWQGVDMCCKSQIQNWAPTI